MNELTNPIIVSAYNYHQFGRFSAAVRLLAMGECFTVEFQDLTPFKVCVGLDTAYISNLPIQYEPEFNLRSSMKTFSFTFNFLFNSLNFYLIICLIN